MSPSKSVFSRVVNGKSWLSLRRATSHDVNYILPYGFGLVFPRCYARLRTWLHDPEGSCPNCGLGASMGVVSLHCCCRVGSVDRLALFLPGTPTMALMRQESVDLASEYPILSVRKVERPAAAVEAILATKQRSRPLEDPEISSAKMALMGSAMHFFAGEMPPERAIDLFWPWNTAKDLLDSP